MIIYVINNCPFCKKAIMALDYYHLKYKVIRVKKSEKDYYKKQNKMETFPQIFNGKTKIGGYDNLIEYLTILN
jgi:glutaredoxin